MNNDVCILCNEFYISYKVRKAQKKVQKYGNKLIH